jgi:hypothetical protein
LSERGWQINGECRAAGRKCFRLDVSAVFANDGHADAEPQAGAASGTLGGVKGIEDFRKRFRADADAVILNGDGHLLAVSSAANLDSA